MIVYTIAATEMNLPTPAVANARVESSVASVNVCMQSSL